MFELVLRMAQLALLEGLSDKSMFLETLKVTKGCAEKPFYGDGLAVFYANTNLRHMVAHLEHYKFISSRMRTNSWVYGCVVN